MDNMEKIKMVTASNKSGRINNRRIIKESIDKWHLHKPARECNVEAGGFRIFRIREPEKPAPG
ncbi:hypothetical protein hrd7_16610 [Leptolinea sp. HRD-7]|nr:hypothetical protein hrd7_16610 [Leptolinea sp. HRD-7]